MEAARKPAKIWEKASVRARVTRGVFGARTTMQMTNTATSEPFIAVRDARAGAIEWFGGVVCVQNRIALPTPTVDVRFLANRATSRQEVKL